MTTQTHRTRRQPNARRGWVKRLKARLGARGMAAAVYRVATKRWGL